jgi:hypothetical protein
LTCAGDYDKIIEISKEYEGQNKNLVFNGIIDLYDNIINT